MKTDKKFVIRLLLIVGLAGLIISWLAGNQFIFKFNDEPIQIFQDFEEFAFIFTVLGEALPSFVKQFVSVGALGTQFLMISRMNPFIFTAFLALGQLAGQIILYVIGMFVRKVHKGSIGDLASKSHFLHQHHFLIYFAVPFAGVLGDAVLIYSGHQRINLLKILPFLYASNYLDNAKWVFTTIGQLELGNLFEQ